MNLLRNSGRGLKVFQWGYHEIDTMQLDGKCHCRQKTNEQNNTLFFKVFSQEMSSTHDAVKQGKVPINFNEIKTLNTLLVQKMKTTIQWWNSGFQILPTNLFMYGKETMYHKSPKDCRKRSQVLHGLPNCPGYLYHDYCWMSPFFSY